MGISMTSIIIGVAVAVAIVVALVFGMSGKKKQ